jgi:hypothetical protein
MNHHRSSLLLFLTLVIILLLSFQPPPVSGFSPNTILRQLTNAAAASVGAGGAPPKKKKWNENGRDEDYPWCFTGRLWFRPALVRVPVPSTNNNNNKNLADPSPPPSVSVLNIFGWTIGGTVALEYDTSPVGPYKEYVTMGALVSKRGAVGQWGSRLYVSTEVAEDVCRDVWGVPAQVADMDFVEDDGDNNTNKQSLLSVESAPDKFVTGKRQMIEVRGWSNTRVLTDEELDDWKPKGGLPVLWTPTIKALWAPLIPLPASRRSDEEDSLPLHRLRLSASALRLQLCPQSSSDLLGIPIGVGLVVDNVLIEISRQDGEL